MINATVAGNGGNRRRSRALSRENIRQDTRRGSRAGSKSNVLDIDGLDGTLRSGCRCGSKSNIFGSVNIVNKEQKHKVSVSSFNVYLYYEKSLQRDPQMYRSLQNLNFYPGREN